MRNGQRVQRKKLKPIEEGNPVLFSYLPIPEGEEEQRPLTEAERQREFEKKPENRIVVPDQIVEPHSFVERTEEALRQATPNAAGIVTPESDRCLSISVSQTMIDRTLRIFDSILKALDARGIRVSIDAERKPRTVATVLGEKIGFWIFEETKSVERPPTPEEKKRDELWDRLNEKSSRYYRSVATGKLLLRICEGKGLQRCWTDRNDRRVETFLNSFVVGLFKAAESVKEERRLAEERQKEVEKELKRHKEEERQRREAELRRREEEERFRCLKADVAAWREAADIRAYVAATRAISSIEPGCKLDETLTWALMVADKIDPLAACAGKGLTDSAKPSVTPAERV